MDTLATYIRKFSKLHVDRSKGAPAPHKAILLLSIIDTIHAKEIIQNSIYITPELVARFKDNLSKLVHSTTFTSNFALPFYHMKSEGFWFFQVKPGREILLTKSNSIRSFTQLKEAVHFVYLQEDLFQLLCNEHNRTLLKHALLTTYFPKATSSYATQENGLVAQIVEQILNDSPAAYQHKVNTIDEEEVFVRGGVFKKVIPKAYNYTCSISRMRLIADRDIQMIDACHIVPFSQSHDDTISNGISLCPNLHRAFDRGLITISDDYTVLVSQAFVEADSEYAIKNYIGKPILLPAESNYYPSVQNLQWHRDHVFKG